MGRLAGFTYREVARRMRKLGFAFDRQGPGSHEVGATPPLGGRLLFPVIRVICPKEHYELFFGKRAMQLRIF